MILENPSHTYIVRTGLYSSVAWAALKDFGEFMERHDLPGEVTRLPTGESVVAFDESFMERKKFKPDFWTCCIMTIRAEDGGRPDESCWLPRHDYWGPHSANDSLLTVLQIIGGFPVMEQVKAEFIGRPFNPFVVAQLETIEKHLEELYGYGIYRAVCKRQYESSMMEIVDR